MKRRKSLLRTPSSTRSITDCTRSFVCRLLYQE